MKRTPRLTYRPDAGVTIIEMMVVVVIIGIVCAIALPNFEKIRNNAYRDQCIINLRRIAAAKEHWSMETGAADTDEPIAGDLDPYIKNKTAKLICPIDAQQTFSTSYSINAVNANPACRISPATHKLP